MKNRRIHYTFKESFHHCISRTVNGEFLFNKKAKLVFISMLEDVAFFTGVDVLTYCLMDNHFHLLVRIPNAATTIVSDEQILERYKRLYSRPTDYRLIAPHVLEQILKEGGSEAVDIRKKLTARMHNLPMFMKLLKQRFSIWFNKTHNRFGTLWSDRYTNVLVEGQRNPLLTMALYIDLNPVRAGIANEPERYPYCGVGQASNGHREAQKGCQLIARYTGEGESACQSHDWYLSRMKQAVESLKRNSTHLLLHAKYLSQGEILGRSLYVSKTGREFGRGGRCHQVTQNHDLGISRQCRSLKKKRNL